MVADSKTVDRRTAAVDLAIVATLSGAFVLVTELDVPRAWVIAGVAVCLLAFGLWVRRRGGESWRDFGLRTDNLRRGLRPMAIVTVAGVGGMLAFAALAGHPLWHPQIALLLLLYPIWGVAQQAIFQGVALRRLVQLLDSGPRAVPCAAALFALVHWGNPVLVALTFAAGLLWSTLFLRIPNAWLLGISHGILGALAYPLLLGELPLDRF